MDEVIDSFVWFTFFRYIGGVNGYGRQMTDNNDSETIGEKFTFDVKVK